jgi:hypothetical protein
MEIGELVLRILSRPKQNTSREKSSALRTFQRLPRSNTSMSRALLLGTPFDANMPSNGQAARAANPETPEIEPTERDAERYVRDQVGRLLRK